MNEVQQHLVRSFRQRRTLLVTSSVFVLSSIVEYISFHFILGLIHIIISILVLLLVVDVVLAFLIGWVLAEPLAIHAYLREVRRKQKSPSRLYIPLSAAKNLYETPSDASNQRRQQNVHTLLRNNVHLLILGLPGAGKTIALQASHLLTFLLFNPLFLSSLTGRASSSARLSLLTSELALQ